MTTSGWMHHAGRSWWDYCTDDVGIRLYGPNAFRFGHSHAWIADKGDPCTEEHGPDRASLRAYCKRERITLPTLPEEWCPEPVEEPAKPYSLADDPRLREVVRTKWGEARWRDRGSRKCLYVSGNYGLDYIAELYPTGRWWVYGGPNGVVEGSGSGMATNPANAYDECMAALRDIGSLVDEEPDADGWIPWGGGECPVPAGTVVEYRLHDGGVDTDKAGELDWDHCDCADIIAYRIISSHEPTEKPDANACAVQPPTLRDRLLNLSTRMWLDGSPYANELRDLARELDGGDQ